MGASNPNQKVIRMKTKIPSEKLHRNSRDGAIPIAEDGIAARDGEGSNAEGDRAVMTNQILKSSANTT